MTKGILGRKVGMTQVFDPETGVATPVTVIEAGPCKVLQLRSEEKDGYTAVQLGYLDKKRPAKDRRSRSSQAARSERGHKFIRELRGDVGGYEVGADVKVDVLDGVGKVDVIGVSKGRGFAGVMKRHNFSGQRATHGVKKCHRHAGGTGMSASPSRTFKGKRMAGHYGAGRVTVRNIGLHKIDTDNNLLLVAGAVPGPNGGYLVIRETNKK
ncbi:UNVERIFIED_CONTAM: hypothetical protein GTU68_041033 [Idotea baltica]|nr:hypothetical protein [Idotea baltica]